MVPGSLRSSGFRVPGSELGKPGTLNSELGTPAGAELLERDRSRVAWGSGRRAEADVNALVHRRHVYPSGSGQVVGASGRGTAARPRHTERREIRIDENRAA